MRIHIMIVLALATSCFLGAWMARRVEARKSPFGSLLNPIFVLVGLALVITVISPPVKDSSFFFGLGAVMLWLNAAVEQIGATYGRDQLIAWGLDQEMATTGPSMLIILVLIFVYGLGVMFGQRRADKVKKRNGPV